MTPEERQRRLEERLAQMTPEERERFQQRMRERAEQGGGRGLGGQRPEGSERAASAQRQPEGNTAATPAAPARRSSQSGRVANAPSITSGATTIDSLFGPLPEVESRGRAWLWVNKQLKSVPLRLGISDGTYTEVIEGAGLQPGAEVVINLLTGLEPRTTTPGQTGGSQNPLMGPQRGGPGGPGGRGGGGEAIGGKDETAATAVP